MAQTTGAKSKAGFKVEVSTNGTDWDDISGSASTVEPDGGEQMVGEQHTAQGAAPVIVWANKTAAIGLTVSCLYTEVAGEAWRKVWDRYIGTNKAIYLRYSPRGGATGDKRFVCADESGAACLVPIETCLPPDTDADSGDPLMFEFSVLAPKLLEEAVP